jgi:hypothetical protein
VDESPDQIEDHIRSTQRELGNNLQELENKVKDATNWRVQFERHPMALLGVAFAGGLLLSAGLGGQRRRATADNPSWQAPQWSTAATTRSERNSAPSNIWSGIRSTLAAVAGRQVQSVLGELVPGFREQHSATGQSPDPTRSSDDF